MRFSRWLFWMALLPLQSLVAQALPPNLPALRSVWYRDTSLCENIFLSTERFILPMPKESAIMILDKQAQVVWYASADDNLYALEQQANGRMVFSLNNEWYWIDSSFHFQYLPTCASLVPDLHEFRWMADGSSFELCMADTLMDLSGLTTRGGQQGDTLGNVRYTVVLQKDANGAILKSWRAIDHFDLTDADNYFFTLPSYLELNHTNSIDVEGDRVLLSHRSNHEITCLHWPTGRIMWRLGGNHNQFSLSSGPAFTAQHDARFISGNRISLFDNASLSLVNEPRALVYELDTLTMTANLLRNFGLSGASSNSMGGFRVNGFGDALVCWGNVQPANQPNISYYNGRNQLVAHLYWEDPHLSYRAICGNLAYEVPQPQISCERQNGNLILRLVGNYPSQHWNTGATTDFIVLADTGYYQCYVPLGDGFAGSNVYHITDLAATCPVVAADEAQLPRPAEAKSLGVFDLQGRPVGQMQSGQLYIERFDNGQSRKFLKFDK